MITDITARFSALDVEKALQIPDDCRDGRLWPGLRNAVVDGDVDQVRNLHEDGADLRHQDEAGVSALMLAAEQGHEDSIVYLLKQGVPWNALDKTGNSAGEYALEQVEGILLDWAVLCEQHMMSQEQQEELDAEGERYLKQKVCYEGGNLLDAQGEAVMMPWERPLMLAHANLICQSGGDVLNVGFGLGLVDDAIQEYKPRSHTIIEAHPDVYKQMCDQGWDKKENVRVLFGRWQDVAGQLEQYDGIFFDTYSEHYLHMREFHDLVAKVLKKAGIYTFFNGLAPRCPFFSKVYRRVVLEELQQKGLTTEYMELPVQAQGDKWDAEWKGVKTRYWHQGAYYLPIIYFTDADENAETAANTDSRTPT